MEQLAAKSREASSAHIYRDSLVWESFGGRCRSSLLLTPAALDECTDWYAEEFRERFGVGAWQLTPGEDDHLDLGRWILDATA